MADPRGDRRFQEITSWIETQICSEALRPGDRVPPERKLVEQFGVSRTVVREALQDLAARGLVESYVGRGTFVRQPDTGDLARKLGLLVRGDVSLATDALASLVQALGQLAAHRGGGAEKHRLVKLALQAPYEPAATEAFLETLGRAARNPLLATLAGALAALVHPHVGDGLPVDFGAVAAQVGALSGRPA